MRRLLCALGLAITLGALSAPRVLAQPQDASIGEGSDALPGIARLGLPSVGRERVSAALTAGFAYTESSPSTGAVSQLGGKLAVAGAFTPWAAASLSMALRNGSFAGSDAHDADMVSDTRLALRLGHAASASHQIGLELAGIVPSGTGIAPAFGGISAEARLLAAFGISSPTVWLASLGMRLDRSAKAIDTPASVLPADRVLSDLGSREALLLGVGFSHRISDFELLSELGADVLMDTSADELAQSPVRLDLGARYHASRLVQLELMLEGQARALPPLDASSPLAHVPPRMSAMLGVRVGLPAARVAKPSAEPEPEPGPIEAQPEPAPAQPEPAPIEAQPEPAPAAAEPAPAPAAPAPAPATAVPDAEQDADGATVAPVGAPAAGQGTIQGNIRAFDGTPVQATVTVYPLKLKTTTNADGTFEINLDPGRYTVRLRAFGYSSQNRAVVVQENGVTVLNAELRKK